MILDRAALEEARTLARKYWDTFARDPATGNVRAGQGPVLIVDAEALAITLPQSLSELLGAAGAELSIYGFGKSYGLAAADHFEAWANANGASQACSGCGALFWPMHIGLAPRIVVLEAKTEPHVHLLIEIAHGALTDIRAVRGLDTRPARLFVSGLVSGALTKKLGEPVDAREIPSGEDGYRILVAPPAVLAKDLEDTRLTASRESFSDVATIEA